LPKLSKIVFWSVLLAASVAGALWAVGHFAGGYRNFLALAARLDAAHWALLGAATAAFYLLDYARLYTLFRLLGVRIPPGTGLQLTCVSYFVSSLTPTAELNIPAMIFMLRQKAIPASGAAAVAIVKTMYMLAWVCAFGMGTLLLRRDVRLPPAVGDNLFLLTAPAALLILAFFCVIFFPQRVLAWTSIGFLQRCASAISLMGKSTGRMHLLSHAACIAFIAAYALVGAGICHGLDIAMGGGRALTAFSNSLMVSYLAPVPGAIGVGEVATSYLIDPAMTEPGMVAATLLRFLCWYLLAIPGLLFLLNALRLEGLRRC
jgi:uncharacterized membrane protein YbhN (UPF0104 family)